MKDSFSDLNAQIVDPGKIGVAVGAAWRGAVPRSTDTEISLGFQESTLRGDVVDPAGLVSLFPLDRTFKGTFRDEPRL